MKNLLKISFCTFLVVAIIFCFVLHMVYCYLVYRHKTYFDNIFGVTNLNMSTQDIILNQNRISKLFTTQKHSFIINIIYLNTINYPIYKL